MLTPAYIFTNDFNNLEHFFQEQTHIKKSFKKGDYLWSIGEPFDKIHYIYSGIAQNLLEHESGKRKIISFHGQGTVFPGFHTTHFKIEDSLLTIALSDMEVLEFTQAQFQIMFSKNQDLQMQVIDWFSRYSNLLLFEAAHQDYNSMFVKLCNLLYLLLISENGKNSGLTEITQDTLADILGVSLVNLTRGITRLRNDGIISTSRKCIEILDADALAKYCTGEAF